MLFLIAFLFLFCLCFCLLPAWFRRSEGKKENSLIIISHQERILNIADEIVVIADGAVKARGKKSDILPELLDTNGGCRFYQ